MKKIYSICIFIVLCIFSVEGREELSPELDLLSELKKLVSISNDEKIRQLFPFPFADPQKYQREIYSYEQLVPQDHMVFIKLLNELLDRKETQYRPYINKQESNLLTPKQLFDYFEDLFIKKEFTFQNGDILFLLPHSEESYAYASIVKDSYSCGYFIIIEDDKIYVLMLRYGNHLQKIPLYKVLVGMGEYISRFAIYRYNKKFDLDELNYILPYVSRKSEQILYDSCFFNHVRIESPEKFFTKPKYYYDMEFIYSIYRYVLQNDEFDARQDTSLNAIIKANTKDEESFIGILSNAFMTSKSTRDQNLILPKTITFSKDFSQIAAMGANIPVNETFEKYSDSISE